MGVHFLHAQAQIVQIVQQVRKGMQRPRILISISHDR